MVSLQSSAMYGSLCEDPRSLHVSAHTGSTHNYLNSGAAPTTACPGSVLNPQAAGETSVVVQASSGGLRHAESSTRRSTRRSAMKYGAGIILGTAGSNKWAEGTWAVTAPWALFRPNGRKQGMFRAFLLSLTRRRRARRGAVSCIRRRCRDSFTTVGAGVHNLPEERFRPGRSGRFTPGRMTSWSGSFVAAQFPSHERPSPNGLQSA